MIYLSNISALKDLDHQAGIDGLSKIWKLVNATIRDKYRDSRFFFCHDSWEYLSFFSRFVLSFVFKNYPSYPAYFFIRVVVFVCVCVFFSPGTGTRKPTASLWPKANPKSGRGDFTLTGHLLIGYWSLATVGWPLLIGQFCWLADTVSLFLKGRTEGWRHRPQRQLLVAALTVG